MLREGSIFETFMLTKCISQTPLAELYQSIHIDSGDRYLVKIAKPEWQENTSHIKCRGFEFAPGVALPWHPLPSQILKRETMMLQDIADSDLALPKPVLSAETESVSYCVYQFFDGEPLQSLMDSRTRFDTMSIATMLREVSKLHSRGLFHGNLQPSTILISGRNVLLADTTFGASEFEGYRRETLLRCITTPAYYPLLDPRHDQLALGLMLYNFLVQRHPLLSPPLFREQRIVRRLSPRLQSVIDEARERGANRFLTPLLNFVNPSQVKRKLAGQVEDLLLRTIGIMRIGVGGDEEMLDVVPGSWLDYCLNPFEGEVKDLWTLDKTADAISDFLSRKQPPRPVSSEAAEEPPDSDIQAAS